MSFRYFGDGKELGYVTIAKGSIGVTLTALDMEIH